MALLVVLHPLLRECYNYIKPTSNGENARPDAQAERRLHQRVAYDLLFSTVFIFALHGFSAFKVLLILYLNFTLATSVPRSCIPAASWIFNISVLFANEYFGGYRYSNAIGFLSSVSSPPGTAPTANWGNLLDSYGGLIPRWEILFNITVLRLISFDLDYYWSLDYRAGSPVEVCIILLYNTQQQC